LIFRRLSYGTSLQAFGQPFFRQSKRSKDAHNIAVGVDTRSGAGLAHRLARSDRDNRREAPPCPCKPSDVQRPVRQPWLPLWRRPCGHIARRKGDSPQARPGARRQARPIPIRRRGREASCRPWGCDHPATTRQSAPRFTFWWHFNKRSLRVTGRFHRLCEKAMKNSYNMQEKVIYLRNGGWKLSTLPYYRSAQRHCRLEEQRAQYLC
jgi:hypothetical protein